MVEDVLELLALPDGARIAVLEDMGGQDREALLLELERHVRRGQGEERLEALEVLEAAAPASLWSGFEALLRDTFKEASGAFGGFVAEKIGGWELVDMVPELMQRLEESDEPTLRFWCIYALGNLGAMEAVDAIKAVRGDLREVDGWWSVGEEADYMLRQLLGEWPHLTPRADAVLGV